MFKIQYVLPSPIIETAQSPLSEEPVDQPGRRRLRLYLVGSKTHTQQTIDRLHLLGYAERFEWSQVIPIPENGLVIRPDPGDVLRYLQRFVW